MTCVEKQELITIISKVPKDFNKIVAKHCEDTAFLVNFLPDDTCLWTEFQRLWHLKAKNLFLWLQDPSVNKKRKQNLDQPNQLNTKNKPIKIRSTSPKKTLSHGAKSSVADKELQSKDTRPPRPTTEAPIQDNSRRNRTKSVAVPSPQKNIEPAASDVDSGLDGSRRKIDRTDMLVRSKSASPPTMKKTIDSFKAEQKRKKELETGKNTKNMDLKKTVDSKEQTEIIQKMDSEITVDTKKTIMEMVMVEPKYKIRKKHEKINNNMIRTNSASPTSMKYSIDSFKTDLKRKKDTEKKNLGPVNNYSEKEIAPPRETKNRSRKQSLVKEHSSGGPKRTGDRRRILSKDGGKGNSPGKGRARMENNIGEETKKGEVGVVTGKGKAEGGGKKAEKENRKNKEQERGITNNEVNEEIREWKENTESDLGEGKVITEEEQSVEDGLVIKLIDDDTKEKMESTEEFEDKENVEITEDPEKTEMELQNLNEQKPEEMKSGKQTEFIVEKENFNLEKENNDISRRAEVDTIQTDLKTVENPSDNHIQMEKEEEKQNATTKPDPRNEKKYSTNSKENRYSWFGTSIDCPEKIIILKKRRLSDSRHDKKRLRLKQVYNSMVSSPKGGPDGTVDSGNVTVQKQINELGNQSDSQNVSEKSNGDLNELLPVDNVLYHKDLSKPNSLIFKGITESRARRHSAPLINDKETFSNHIRSSSEPVVSKTVSHREDGSYETFHLSSMDNAANQDNPLHQSTSTSPTNIDDSNKNGTQKSRLNSLDNKRNMYANFRTMSAPSFKFSGDNPQPLPVTKKTRAPKGAYESPEKLQLRKPFAPIVRVQTLPNKAKRKKTGFGITVLTKTVSGGGKQEDPKPEIRPELNLPQRKPPKKNGSIQSRASTAKMNSISPMSNTLKNTKEHLDNYIGLLNEEELSFLIDHLVKSKAGTYPLTA